MSYDDQLDFIHVSKMTGRELRKVVRNCKKARFHVDIWEDHPFLPSIRTIGSRLEKIRYHLYTDAINAEEWAAAWSLCSSRVEVLHATQLTLGEITAIMDTPKTFLKEIRIDSTYFDEDQSITKEAMKIITKGTKNVERFYFGDENPFSLVDFHKFIDKNKSTLKSFSIVNYSARETLPPLAISELISKLLECAVLEEVAFKEQPSQSTLKSLQRHGIHFQKYIK